MGMVICPLDKLLGEPDSLCSLHTYSAFISVSPSIISCGLAGFCSGVSRPYNVSFLLKFLNPIFRKKQFRLDFVSLAGDQA